MSNHLYHNKLQNNVIEKVLDKILENNDILIKRNVYNYLSGKCENCKDNVINPVIFDNKKIVCTKCIHRYVFCVKRGCKTIKLFNKAWNESCSKCFGWLCSKHKTDDKCCCGD